MMDLFSVSIMEAPYAADEVCIDNLTEEELLQLIKLCCTHGLLVTVTWGA